MANTTIALKKSATPAAVPAALANGELALNFADGKLYYKNATGQIVSFSAATVGNSFGIANVDNTLILSGTGNDVLNFISGNNISLSACTITKTITINGTGTGGGASVAVSTVAPSSPTANSLWWNSNIGRLFIYYNDGDSSQWVEVNPSGGTANTSALIDVGSYINANNAANSANAYTVTVGTSGNNYTISVGAASNTWANGIGTAGNNYSVAIGAASNNYANSSFTTISDGAAAFAKANAALANTSGTFQGDLRVTANLVSNTVSSLSGLIDLGPGSRPTYLEGRIYYDNVDKSLNVYNEESGFNVPLGQKEYVRVYNNTGTTISKGKAVYATGYHTTSHHHPTIALADASNAAKYDVLGLAAADIPDASHGYVIVRGWIGGIDTSTLTAGTRFHLGFTSPGSLVTISPEYPNYPFDIGYCVVSDATNGYLYIDRQSHTQESLRVLGPARIGGDMYVEGDFTVLGTQTVTSTTSLSLGTQYIYLSAGDSIPNSNVYFTGSGLNDLSFRGHYEGVGTTDFYVTITEANATGDYFTWSYNNFVSNVASNVKILYQTNQLLSNGISVYFQANTGHTIGNKWNASVTAVSTDAGFVTNHTDPGKYTHAGLFRDATDGTFKFFNTYDAEPVGNIDIANNTFSLGNVQVRKITAEQIFAGSTEIGSLVPIISDRANAAFDKANSANSLAFNTGIGANAWANSIVTAANNWANTKLTNGSVTLDGTLTTTGQLVANGTMWLTPVAGLNEGGEINLLGAGNFPDWTIDSYQNNLRLFSTNANTMLVQIFNAGAGTMSMDISGNLTVQGANVGSVAANAAIEYVIDGGGATITTGEKGFLEVPFPCIIKQCTILLDQAGSINVAVQKAAYANFPPGPNNSINASGFVITNAVKVQIDGASIETTTIATGDVLAYNVASIATATRATVSLKVIKI